MRLFALIILLVGCSGEQGDGTPVTDAPVGCGVSLSFDPSMALAGPSTEIRATALVSGAPGVLTYLWDVTRAGNEVTYSFAQVDHSSVSFLAPTAGPYRVMVAVSGQGAFCPTAQSDVNVGVAGGNMEQVRLRVWPPSTINAPPAEKLVLVPGGAAYSVGTVPVDPGVLASGTVRSGTTGVSAYLRFIPLGARDAYVEAFTAPDGSFTNVRVLNQVHDVLVVPTMAGFAPRIVETWTPLVTTMSVDTGMPISGVVRDPSGAAIAGAKVQLTLDGVPSTLATTDGAGAFTVRATIPGGTPDVTVDVTPPVATGLPRITTTSANLSPASAFVIQYASALVRRDIGGTVVRRGGTAQSNAPVKIVGTIAAVATITATGSASANGEVRIATTTNGAGAIPNNTLAPAAPLFAVSTIGAQHAVDAFDLSTSVPATIDAPTSVQLDTQLRNAAGLALSNAVLQLVPSGALALAGVPTIRVTANGTGNISTLVPAGGRFDVRASDPFGRGAPLVVADVPVQNLATMYALKPSLNVSGSLVLSGNPQPVGRATVQILCTLCTGADRWRPLAEGASSTTGAFDVAVSDPGVSN